MTSITVRTMSRSALWPVIALVIIVVSFIAILNKGPAPVGAETAQPGTAAAIAGSDLKRVTLTADAAKRIDLQTATVRLQTVAGQVRQTVPFSAVIYDPSGATWTFTNPEPLVFVRASVKLDRVVGDLAILSSGPASGTTVVTVGVAELYGVEAGVGK